MHEPRLLQWRAEAATSAVSPKSTLVALIIIIMSASTSRKKQQHKQLRVVEVPPPPSRGGEEQQGPQKKQKKMQLNCGDDKLMFQLTWDRAVRYQEQTTGLIGMGT